jgi:hypothetical protein
MFLCRYSHCIILLCLENIALGKQTVLSSSLATAGREEYIGVNDSLGLAVDGDPATCTTTGSAAYHGLEWLYVDGGTDWLIHSVRITSGNGIPNFFTDVVCTGLLFPIMLYKVCCQM